MIDAIRLVANRSWQTSEVVWLCAAFMVAGFVVQMIWDGKGKGKMTVFDWAMWGTGVCFWVIVLVMAIDWIAAKLGDK